MNVHAADALHCQLPSEIQLRIKLVRINFTPFATSAL